MIFHNHESTAKISSTTTTSSLMCHRIFCETTDTKLGRNSASHHTQLLYIWTYSDLVLVFFVFLSDKTKKKYILQAQTTSDFNKEANAWRNGFSISCKKYIHNQGLRFFIIIIIRIQLCAPQSSQGHNFVEHTCNFNASFS